MILCYNGGTDGTALITRIVGLGCVSVLLGQLSCRHNRRTIHRLRTLALLNITLLGTHAKAGDILDRFGHPRKNYTCTVIFTVCE